MLDSRKVGALKGSSMAKEGFEVMLNADCDKPKV
jgi:hypothetical protein